MVSRLDAQKALDLLIAKARVHFYKPLQVAEILYRDRVFQDIDLSNLETYRNPSKRWRDKVCLRFLGRTSTSSARYQDDLFNKTAMPPDVLVELGRLNRATGNVESYIYQRFAQRLSQVSIGIDYCHQHNEETFKLAEFLGLFWNEPGLRRSIDKIYEIVVYALFSALVRALGVRISVSMDTSTSDIFYDFQDFAQTVLQLSPDKPQFEVAAEIYRVGVTNAADRGLDMWANFGLAIQVKHLSLTEELAENIVSPITSDRIILVCKDAEERVILSVLNQIGWKSRIQTIITESNLVAWYDKALRGKFAAQVGTTLLDAIIQELEAEFPATNKTDLESFMLMRGYHKFALEGWKT